MAMVLVAAAAAGEEGAAGVCIQQTGILHNTASCSSCTTLWMRVSDVCGSDGSPVKLYKGNVLVACASFLWQVGCCTYWWEVGGVCVTAITNAHFLNGVGPSIACSS
jgi:hypothetical protein